MKGFCKSEGFCFNAEKNGIGGGEYNEAWVAASGRSALLISLHYEYLYYSHGCGRSLEIYK